MKDWFSGGKVPQMGWERDLAHLRRRYKVMGNLIYFFALLGIYHLVNEVICLFWGKECLQFPALRFRYVSS